MEWYDWLGMLGVVLLLLAYFLLQIGKILPSDLSYSLLNLLGSGMIAYSLIEEWNLSAFLIEVFWFLISLYGVFRFYKKRKNNK